MSTSAYRGTDALDSTILVEPKRYAWPQWCCPECGLYLRARIVRPVKNGNEWACDVMFLGRMGCGSRWISDVTMERT